MPGKPCYEDPGFSQVRACYIHLHRLRRLRLAASLPTMPDLWVSYTDLGIVTSESCWQPITGRCSVYSYHGVGICQSQWGYKFPKPSL